MTNSDSIRATNKSETQQDRTRKTGAVEPTDRSRLDPRRSRQKMVCMMIAEPRRRPSGPGPPSGSRAPHENQEPRKERGGRQDTRSRRGRRVKGRAGWEELKAGSSLTCRKTKQNTKIHRSESVRERRGGDERKKNIHSKLLHIHKHDVSMPIDVYKKVYGSVYALYIYTYSHTCIDTKERDI